MAFGFISTYLGGILIQAIVNIFVYAPAIIVALYLYDRFMDMLKMYKVSTNISQDYK